MRIPRPRAKGFLPVSGGHTLHYELVGSPRGIPCVFFHGGPGGSCEESDKRFFDFRKYQVLFFDQRGCGKSVPFAERHANTTPLLVEDAHALMDLVGFKDALFFGGSWGSTLALATAVKNPKRCRGLIVRGIYLADNEADRYFMKGGWRSHFPEVWERFAGAVPAAQRHDPARYYFQKMFHGTKTERRRFCFEWARMEFALFLTALPAREIDKAVRSAPFISLATLEAHYFKHHCFLPPNYLLKGAKKLSRIPTWILQGRQDFVCPPMQAFALHRAIRGSKLILVSAGHSSRDPELEAAIKGALREFRQQ